MRMKEVISKYKFLFLPSQLSTFNSCGQTLIELLVALAIGVTLVTSAVVTVTKTLNNAQSITDRSQATKYAQEGMEVVQQIRDSDYTSFQNYNGTYCLDKGLIVLGNPVPACSTANVDKFIRSVVIERDGCASNVSRVSVTVSWADTSCAADNYCQSVPLVSCLSTQNPIQGP